MRVHVPQHTAQPAPDHVTPPRCLCGTRTPATECWPGRGGALSSCCLLSRTSFSAAGGRDRRGRMYGASFAFFGPEAVLCPHSEKGPGPSMPPVVTPRAVLHQRHRGSGRHTDFQQPLRVHLRHVAAPLPGGLGRAQSGSSSSPTQRPLLRSHTGCSPPHHSEQLPCSSPVSGWALSCSGASNLQRTAAF